MIENNNKRAARASAGRQRALPQRAAQLHSTSANFICKQKAKADVLLRCIHGWDLAMFKPSGRLIAPRKCTIEGLIANGFALKAMRHSSETLCGRRDI